MKQPGPRFGAGIDAVEAGRRGGVASGVSRRLRPQRRLEEAIASTKNGAAIYGLYRTQLERDKALERERHRADQTLLWLMDETDRERATITRLRERRRQYETVLAERFAKLEERERQLAAAVAADEGELVDRLRQLDQAGGLDTVLEATGLLERAEGD
jgi:hypothetical protein